MTTLLQLKSFVTVVDQGGFTAASRRLGLSQPAVSRAVATLEKELRLPLLVRGRDGVSLTEAGALALTHAREAVRQLTLMRTEVAALSGDVTGTLSLASLPSVTATLVAPQLRVLRRAISGRDDPACSRGARRRCGTGWIRAPLRPVWSACPPADWTPRCSATRTWSRSCPPPTAWPHRREVSYADLAKEPFVRSTGGCAEVFTPVARRVGVRLRRGLPSARNVRCPRDSPCRTRRQHYAERRPARSAGRRLSCVHWSPRPSGTSASPSPRAHPRPPVRSSSRSRRSISTELRRVPYRVV